MIEQLPSEGDEEEVNTAFHSTATVMGGRAGAHVSLFELLHFELKQIISLVYRYKSPL